MNKSARILLIDESEDARLLITEHLSAEGVEAECERIDTPADAARAVTKASWDAILCDVRPPTSDAHKIIDLARSHTPEIPVLLVSSILSVEDLADLMGAGAADVVRKSHLQRLGPALKRELKASQTQRQRRKFEAQLQAAIEHAAQGLTMFDEHKRLILCNSRYAEMYGFPVELTKRGTTLAELVEDRKARGVFGTTSSDKYIWERAEWSRDSLEERRIQYLADGRVIAMSRRPLPAGGWVTTHDDITEQKRAEAELIGHRDHLQELVDAATRQLKSKNRELEKSLRKERELNLLKSEFVSMASHEFRTPLAIIDLTAQRVWRRAGKGRLTSEDAIRWMDKIMSAAKRMTQLMESTLSAARMDSKGITLKPADCDVKKLLKDLIARHRDMSPRSTIVCDLSNLPETIRADGGALDQVFSNLVSNAIKYSNNEGKIKILGYQSISDIHIEIEDNGVGVDEDDIPRLFERYFRAKTSTGIPGTGVGLNIVKAMVEKHGGEISVTSKKGMGSVFTVRLPMEGPASDRDLARDLAAAPEAPAGEQAAAPRRQPAPSIMQ